SRRCSASRSSWPGCSERPPAAAPRQYEGGCLPADRRLRIAYVVKRFPRYSETFIVNELLAHEAAGCEIEVFSLRPPLDTHFQDRLARLRAPVRYVASERVKPHEYWTAWYGAFEAGGSLDVLLCDNLAWEGHEVYQSV